MDGGVGVRVGREQHPPGVGVQLDRLEEKPGAGHLRHALVHQEERDLVAALEELLESLESLGAGGGLDDAVVRTEVMPKVALDGLEDLAIVIDGEQDGLLHTFRICGASACGARVKCLTGEGPGLE
jgi:hypothetical protein